MQRCGCTTTCPRPRPRAHPFAVVRPGINNPRSLCLTFGTSHPSISIATHLSVHCPVWASSDPRLFCDAAANSIPTSKQINPTPSIHLPSPCLSTHNLLAPNVPRAATYQGSRGLVPQPLRHHARGGWMLSLHHGPVQTASKGTRKNLPDETLRRVAW